jgi:hypothetical protein
LHCLDKNPKKEEENSFKIYLHQGPTVSLVCER